MAIKRQNNILGQQRIDVPDLRAIESGVANDFDTLAGQVWTGEESLIVRGFTIPTASTFGNPASSLQLNVADGLVMHYNGTEAGTTLPVTVGRSLENLNVGNSRVSGAFTSSAVNYVGIDFIRSADSSTADTTKFYDPNSQGETTRTVPKARTLDYKIYISVTPFSFTQNICPIAKVQTDSSGNVVSVTDARQMMFRLGSGGDSPNEFNSYGWRDTNRRENPITYAPVTYTDDPFSGGDKQILSMKEWMDSVTTVLWEAKSGEFWYSPTSRDIMKVVYAPGPAALVSGDNFQWVLGTETLTWVNLFVMFENASGGYYNTVTDGSDILADGQCLYVDVDRTDSVTPIVAMVADLESLPAPAIPGSRIVIAYRLGSYIYARDRSYELGRSFTVATPVTTPGSTPGGVLGLVKLSHAAVTPSAPIVMSDGAANVAFGFVALSSNRTANYTAVSGDALTVSTPTVSGKGISGSATGTNGIGVYGYGSLSDSYGVQGLSDGADGFGVRGRANGANGIGVLGQGSISGANAHGVRGESRGFGVGVYGLGGSSGTDTHGVYGVSQGFGNGVRGLSAFSNRDAVYGEATGASANGVTGTTQTGFGVYGLGGTSGSNRHGVYGVSQGFGNGVYGVGFGSNDAVVGVGSGTNINSYGVRGDGNGIAPGGRFDGIGTGAGSVDNALEVDQNISMLGTNGVAGTAFSNKISKSHVLKAWGDIYLTGITNTSPNNCTRFGINVGNCEHVSGAGAKGGFTSYVYVDFPAGGQMTDRFYAVSVFSPNFTGAGATAPYTYALNLGAMVIEKSATGFVVGFYDPSTAAAYNIDLQNYAFSFTVHGNQ